MKKINSLAMKTIRGNTLMQRFIPLMIVMLSVLLLSACGGGAETTANPITSNTPVSNYNGPAPKTGDVQAFRINLWENIKASNRCGACHGAGGQAPDFANNNDVNLAYNAANTVVNLSSPKDSRMVTKVAGGHNCWESNDAVCATILTNWIAAWAGDTASGGTVIQLDPPPIKPVGASKTFPADNGVLFGSTVHPLLVQRCSGCHQPSALTPQSPYFADTDVAAAYDAVKPKINLDTPGDSRLVVRLRDEFHNCWSDCGSNAGEMLTAITNFANGIQPTQVDPNLVISKALTLVDGTVASGGNRFENNQIALWQFKTGNGTTAFDTSGVEPAINLSLSGEVDWVGGWGINVKNGKAQGSTLSSKKLNDLIQPTGEYSIEAWVAPSNVTQEDARIVSYSGSNTARNFTLGQTLYNYDFFNRSDVTGINGDPALSTDDADEDLQATLQHVVVTYDPVNGRRIYVNGVFTDDVDANGGGILTDWDDSFAFVLGNEVSGERQWQGVIRLVAIHNRALTPAQIQQNFDVGVGEKFFLLFSVSDLVNVPQSYVMFEVSQFDSYSYLFLRPTFITLDPNASPDNIPVKGIRIGINGTEAAVGQAYSKVDTVITGSSYTPAGQVLSDLGTIIALEKGPDSDEFFLSFEQLGSNTNVFTEPTPLPPAAPADGSPVADIGVRTFDEINITMADMTGVNPSVVKPTYDTLRQQLPAVEAVDSFLSAHQMGIAQLAIEYCGALVDDSALSTSFFGAASPNITQVIDALYNKMVAHDASGAALASAPAKADISTELTSLHGRLCPAGCGTPQREQAAIKSMCAAVLGSAAMLVQ